VCSNGSNFSVEQRILITGQRGTGNNIRKSHKDFEAQLQRVNQNVFSRYNACLLPNGEYFQRLL
jgi:hypothetical protein